MKVQGALKVQANLKKLARVVRKHQGKAIGENGAQLVAVAKVLIPKDSGDSAAQITGRMVDETSYLADFGPKSKVIEGGRKPGVAASGKAYGAARAQPFVNPALSVTAKRRRARMRRAVSKAVKEVMNDG